jgi:ribosomal protein S18 acetylase RimI-like enzyme
VTAPDSGTDIAYRRPTEADHRAIVSLVDEWWGGRRIHHLLPRLWFQHFTATSWLAETGAGRPAGFLVGFISPDDTTTAYVHMIGTDPNLRRHGLGRELYERFMGDVAERGAVRVRAITWPGNHASVAFHGALGFRLVDGPGSQNLYGHIAFPDYDSPGDDRAVFERALDPTSGGR